jgi:hypothetical protein
MKQMRIDLRMALKQLTPIKNGTLYCKFCTNENNSFFDVENVLLYNVGSGAFSHLSSHHLLIERSFEKLPSLKNTSTLNHYHLYKYIHKEHIKSYWEKEDTIINFKKIQLPSLKENPHEYWYSMKQLKFKTKYQLNKDTNYGIKINFGVPSGKKVNLTYIVKPLIDGVISAFHSYFGDDINEVAIRLASLLDKEKNEIIDLLLEEKSAVLGRREVIRTFQKGIQWNPADDFCFQIDIKTYNASSLNWVIDGELYTIRPKR